MVYLKKKKDFGKIGYPFGDKFRNPPHILYIQIDFR